jgi:hypothetical protein
MNIICQWSPDTERGEPRNGSTPHLIELRLPGDRYLVAPAPTLPFGYSILPRDLVAPANPFPLGRTPPAIRLG